MGYRSNGGIVIYGPEERMTAHLFQLRATQTHPDAWNDSSEVRVYKRGEFLVWHFEYTDWKWYPDYPSVCEFERIYAESEDVEDLSGYYWRIGEDPTDIKCSSFGDARDVDISVQISHEFEGAAP